MEFMTCNERGRCWKGLGMSDRNIVLGGQCMVASGKGVVFFIQTISVMARDLLVQVMRWVFL